MKSIRERCVTLTASRVANDRTHGVVASQSYIPAHARGQCKSPNRQPPFGTRGARFVSDGSPRGLHGQTPRWWRRSAPHMRLLAAPKESRAFMSILFASAASASPTRLIQGGFGGPGPSRTRISVFGQTKRNGIPALPLGLPGTPVDQPPPGSLYLYGHLATADALQF
jgi:hypothetical protein